MILPILAYGSPVLRKECKEIDANYPDLKSLISDMKETMYKARGVGLAAPQIGKSICMFIIDASPFGDNKELPEQKRKMLSNFKHTFINPKIIKEEGEQWAFNEGCLSIPDIMEDVFRKRKITVEYQDKNFKPHTLVLDGLAARIFQHEYDHIKGILFTDKLSSFKKTLLKNKLKKISEGKIKVEYQMDFPNKRR